MRAAPAAAPAPPPDMDPVARFFSRQPVDRIKKYEPGCTLLDCQKQPPGQQRLQLPQFIYIPVVGPTGNGKSSFIETCEHVIRGQPCAFFRRSPHRGAIGIQSFTSEASLVPLTNCVVLIDTIGSRVGSTPVDRLKEWDNMSWGQWIAMRMTQASFSVAEIHCPIFVWSGEKLNTISDLKDPCESFKIATGMFLLCG